MHVCAFEDVHDDTPVIDLCVTDDLCPDALDDRLGFTPNRALVSAARAAGHRLPDALVKRLAHGRSAPRTFGQTRGTTRALLALASRPLSRPRTLAVQNRQDSLEALKGGRRVKAPRQESRDQSAWSYVRAALPAETCGCRASFERLAPPCSGPYACLQSGQRVS